MNTPALQTSELTKLYKGDLGQKNHLALNNLNLEIPQGEVFAFLGPNGAGKSTTIKLLTRLLKPTRGRIDLLGCDNQSPDALKRVGYLPEQPALYGYLSGKEFLYYMARLHGLSIRREKKRIDTLIETVGLQHRSNDAIRGYSRGMTQRLALAQALVHDPDLLILDEPMANLDPIGRKDFRDLILSLKQQGKTIFFSSHILNDAEMIADRIGILKQGTLIKIGTMEELTLKTADVELTCRTTRDVIDTLNLTEAVFTRQGDQFMLRLSGEKIHNTIQALTEVNARIESVVPQRATLEDIFMGEIGGKTL